jgi:quercetin dioxygenase-like cupin family protein
LAGTEGSTEVATPEAGVPFDPSRTPIGLTSQGDARALEWPPGPPPRIEGYTMGLAAMEANAPHGGEMHPDGDEILVLVSGRVELVLEYADGNRRVALPPGRAIIVPKGIWHEEICVCSDGIDNDGDGLGA